MTTILKGSLILIVLAALVLAALAGPAGQQAAVSLSSLDLAADSGAAEAMAFEASPAERDFGLALIAAPSVEITGTHADDKHPEAQLVRDACNKNGIYQVWREYRDRSVHHLLCKLDDGRIGDWIIRLLDDGRKVEKTAFIPRNGVWNQVYKWLAGKACRYTGGW